MTKPCSQAWKSSTSTAKQPILAGQADTTDILVLPAPAKINHFLHITGRRADGYHLLQTAFQFLDYSDEIQLQLRTDHLIQRCGQNADIPAQDDLVVKAAERLQKYTAVQAGANITVNKKLPLGGGLGGGSSDAATTLLGLNQLWNCRLGLDELAQLGLQLGADVPVFVHGHAAWAEGVGEQLTFIDLPENWYLILHPNVHVSTAEIFANEGLTRHCQPIKIATSFNGQTRNVFTPVVRKMFPAVDIAYNWLSKHATTKMTGSGACLFTEFESEAQAKQVLAVMPDQWSGFVARSASVSPLHKKLKTVM